MKKFELTMMCTSCKWKIAAELEKYHYKNFEIDMDTSILKFEEDVNPNKVVRIVNGIGYKIEPIDDEFDDLTDEELAILEYELKNGYQPE